MKKYLIILLLLALHFRLYAQQFSQYNTGTLYDSFENPSQKAFTPDSSRKIAFNFLIPNFGTDFTLAGNAQGALKNRAFLSAYTDQSLQPGQNSYNYAKVNLNAYVLMFKLYSSLNGNQEVGVSWQSRFEGRGVFTDDAIQLMADNTKFTNSLYSDQFNYNFKYQAYHQLGVTYRADLDDQFSVGVKTSLLMGVISNEVNTYHSTLRFDRESDRAFLSLAGTYNASFVPGKYSTHDNLPSLKNPGASINAGVSYLSEDKIKVQLNLKDLGFIHWNSQSYVGNFDNTAVLNGLSRPGFEDTVTKATSSLVQSNSVQRSFTSHTNGLIELSGSKPVWLDNLGITYTPTAILSKELFYTGFTGAVVNHFKYRNITGTVTGSYNDMKFFSLGLQLMVKTPNAEFFIGSDRIPQTASMLSATLNTASPEIAKNATYTGENFFIGFSLKFGQVIEHPYNAHVIPMGDDRSFLTRLWQRISGYTY